MPERIGGQMKLGVMTKVFPRPTIEAVAEAVRGAGLAAVQLNLESAGMETLPPALEAGVCRRIREAFAERGIDVSAVSGTFNAIDPDRARREECVRRLGILAARCAELGTGVITLCTGTRDAGSMWRAHPENGTAAAWEEMVGTMRALVRHAEAHGVTLAFEPEVVNVVDTAEKAERLIAEIGSDHLRVVMDPANYFHPPMLDRMTEVLEDAFAHVGRFIALAHAKDVRAPAPGSDECLRPAAGTGVLDYDRYLRLLRAAGYDGGLIMHSLDEAEVPASKAYVERYLPA
jgi:sugar phosphate isomerase/epimerase